MSKFLVYRLLSPVLMPLCLKKFGGIWGMKRHLQRKGGDDRLLLYLYDRHFAKTGSWIGVNSQFSGDPFFPHGVYGVFVSQRAKIGKNAIIFQHVTIGSNTLNDSNGAGAPTVGDNVYIGAGAKIIGKVSVGNNCRIGANAVVYEDMPPHSVAVQSPTRVIQKKNLDNRFYAMKDGNWIFHEDGFWIDDLTKKT